MCYVHVLACGGAETGVGVETAGGGVGVAVGRTEGVTCAVVGEGGFVGWAAGRGG